MLRAQEGLVDLVHAGLWRRRRLRRDFNGGGGRLHARPVGRRREPGVARHEREPRRIDHAHGRDAAALRVTIGARVEQRRFPRRADFGEHFAEEGFQRAAGDRIIAGVVNDRGRMLAHHAIGVRCIERVAQACGELGHVVIGREIAGDSVSHEIGDAADGEGDQRGAAGHRFQHDVGLVVLDRGQRRDVGRIVDARELCVVVDEAERNGRQVEALQVRGRSAEGQHLEAAGGDVGRCTRIALQNVHRGDEMAETLAPLAAVIGAKQHDAIVRRDG